MDIYSKLGSKAYDTFKKKNETIKLKKEMLEFVKGQLLSIEELEQLKAEQQKLSEKLKQQQDKVAVLKKLIDTKNRIETIKNEIKELLKRLNETEEKEKEFKLYKKEKVERHKQLLPFVEVIQSYMATQERIKEIQTQVKDESRKKQIGKTDQQELIKEIQAFIQQPTDAAYAITQISNFRQKVNELITNKQQEENSLHQQQKRVKPFLSKP
jgi:chromosome segregation ATPase